MLQALIGPLSNLVGGVLDKLWMDRGEKERLEFSKDELKATMLLTMAQLDLKQQESIYNDLASSRALAMKEMEKAPWATRLINGLVRPYGGLGAITVFFYTIVYSHLGQFVDVELKSLDLNEWQYGILGAIIGFYFVLRQRSKESNVVGIS